MGYDTYLSCADCGDGSTVWKEAACDRGKEICLSVCAVDCVVYIACFFFFIGKYGNRGGRRRTHSSGLYISNGFHVAKLGKNYFFDCWTGYDCALCKNEKESRI